MERIFTPEEIQDMTNRYRAAKKTFGLKSIDRKTALAEPLTDIEKGAVHMYLMEPEKSINEFCKEHKIAYHTFREALTRGATKLLAQNKITV